jgi:Family of unknown function (DUF6165)
MSFKVALQKRLKAAAERMRDAVAGRPARLSITVEISPGELIDKITILTLKHERIANPDKRRRVAVELAMLEAARDRAIPASQDLTNLTADLGAVNLALWEVEDALRLAERERDFGPRFIELARSVYTLNDRRASLKHAINGRLGSRLVEQKVYSG